MCGIAGIFHTDRNNNVDEELLIRITEKLAHRGPDDSRYFVKRNIGVGFKRLSLIDLEHGGQPMSNEDGTVVSVCNGEIFNYVELSKKLRAKGHLLHTNGDCELLPHLYEEFGMAMLDHLNGQFAFAIYDANRNRLHIARDHFGINPLFYTQAGDTFIFASEIKSILEHPDVERRIDLVGLDQVLCFPGVVSPRTLFWRIRSVQPGHYISIDEHGVTSKEYWDFNYPTVDETEEPTNEQYYVSELTRHLQESVSLRLRADVASGVYLSGGLDSSLVAGLVGSLHPQTEHQSFSVSFPQQEMCESAYQTSVARKLRAHHHNVPFGPDEIVKQMKRTVYHAECALKESYDTACLVLSGRARESNVPVILTGEGSDELFAGYVGYRYDRFTINRPEHNSGVSPRERELREQLWGDSSLAYESGDYAGLEQFKERFYSPGVYASLRECNAFTEPIINHERLARRDILHKRSYLDLKLRLADHLLSDHGDRMAMAHAVELRHPFLDINLVNCVLRVPPDLKLNSYTEKYILKQVAAPYVDAEIIEREKFGWYAAGTPVLLNTHREWMEDMLSSERIEQQGYFNSKTIEHLKKQYASENFTLAQPFETDLLMVVLTFNLLVDVFAIPAFA